MHLKEMCMIAITESLLFFHSVVTMAGASTDRTTVELSSPRHNDIVEELHHYDSSLSLPPYMLTARSSLCL